MGREFQAALWFLTEDSWFSEDGKLRDWVFPMGWIQCHSRGMEELQAPGKELGYGGRLFPPCWKIPGELHHSQPSGQKFGNSAVTWTEIPALSNLGKSRNPGFLSGRDLKTHPIPWVGSTEHSRPQIYRQANLRPEFQQESRFLKGINAGYSGRSHPEPVEIPADFCGAARGPWEAFPAFDSLADPFFFWELGKAFPGFSPFPVFPAGSVPSDSSSLCFPALAPEIQGMQMILSL